MLDYRQARLSDARRVLCDHAVKLTLVPGDMDERDIVGLRNAGWDDEQIHLATQIVGYFNYINRIAEGLGVDHEPWMELPAELDRAAWLKAKSSGSGLRS